MGLDSLLADDHRGDPDRDCVAREVPQGSTLVLDSATWVAFLDGICGFDLAPGIALRLVLLRLVGE